MNTTTRPDVVIVGGGIGGLSAALSRAGLTVRVLGAGPRVGEVGAGLQIAPNCTRILAEYGLLEEVTTLGVRPENMVMKDAVDSSELTRLNLEDLERRYGFPYVVIHRGDLHATFPRACRLAGVDLVTGQKCVGVETGDVAARAVRQVRDLANRIKSVAQSSGVSGLYARPVPGYSRGRAACGYDGQIDGHDGAVIRLPGVAASDATTAPLSRPSGLCGHEGAAGAGRVQAKRGRVLPAVRHVDRARTGDGRRDDRGLRGSAGVESVSAWRWLPPSTR